METVGGADEQKNSGLAELRHVSRKAHEAVDEAFSRFELADPQSYGDFLTAHARVAEGLPRAYLSAFHQKGEWPAFLERLGQYLDESDAVRRLAVTEGAVTTFALFRKSAERQG